MAATIKSILGKVKEEDSEKALNAVVATKNAAPEQEGDPDDLAEGYTPDEIPDALIFQMKETSENTKMTTRERLRLKEKGRQRAKQKLEP